MSEKSPKSYCGLFSFNPLSPNSDENEISLYIITTCSNIEVMRMKKIITKDEMS